MAFSSHSRNILTPNLWDCIAFLRPKLPTSYIYFAWGSSLQCIGLWHPREPFWLEFADAGLLTDHGPRNHRRNHDLTCSDLVGKSCQRQEPLPDGSFLLQDCSLKKPEMQVPGAKKKKYKSLSTKIWDNRGPTTHQLKFGKLKIQSYPGFLSEVRNRKWVFFCTVQS